MKDNETRLARPTLRVRKLRHSLVKNQLEAKWNPQHPNPSWDVSFWDSQFSSQVKWDRKRPPQESENC